MSIASHMRALAERNHSSPLVHRDFRSPKSTVMVTYCTAPMHLYSRSLVVMHQPFALLLNPLRLRHSPVLSPCQPQTFSRTIFGRITGPSEPMVENKVYGWRRRKYQMLDSLRRSGMLAGRLYRGYVPMKLQDLMVRYML